jgi:hypothetical protein
MKTADMKKLIKEMDKTSKFLNEKRQKSISGSILEEIASSAYELKFSADRILNDEEES